MTANSTQSDPPDTMLDFSNSKNSYILYCMTQNDHRFIVLIRNIFYEVYSNNMQTKSYSMYIKSQYKILFQNLCKINVYTVF